MDIKRVGVVGCGLMGSGIAEITARAGYDVVVTEVNDDFLKKGIARIESSTQKAVDKGKATAEERAKTLARISGSTNMEDLKGCQLVIEAVVEKMDEKKRVFGVLESICAPDAILASNTSSLAITDMAAATRRPDKVLGLHFMQPVPVMTLLEMVRTFLTSEETFQAARTFGESLGKTIIVSKDTPGFIVNRLLIPYLLQAIEALEALYFASPRPAPDAPGQTADLTAMEGLRFPANRWGRAIANGASPLKAAGFTAGLSVLGPGGGQVPWHHHPDGQREVYLLLGGTGQTCPFLQRRFLGATGQECDRNAQNDCNQPNPHQISFHPDSPFLNHQYFNALLNFYMFT